MDPREIIARRVAQEFKEGFIVNLGVGIPTLAANYLPKDVHIMLQAENGLLGVGPQADVDSATVDCIDAGGSFVSVVAGACSFDSATSFAMIRGGHIDVTVLGGLEADQAGNLANWMIPGKRITGMGGAMDLVCGARRVIVAMEHVNKNGSPKVVASCTMPLTAIHVVNLIITNYAVIRVDPDQGLILEEIAPGQTIESVIANTGAPLTISPDVKWMTIQS
jgi:acetate CoA/acetoacetate CoA-transferase beta subunit